MKFPTCWCGKPSKLTDAHTIPQTRAQFERDADSYVCRKGHVFEAPVPIMVKDGIALRADM